MQEYFIEHIFLYSKIDSKVESQISHVNIEIVAKMLTSDS